MWLILVESSSFELNRVGFYWFGLILNDFGYCSAWLVFNDFEWCRLVSVDVSWFQNAKNESNTVPKWIQNRTKMRQNGAHMGSWWAPDGPRGPRMAARGSKRATRKLQDVPRWPQEAPRWHQGSPRRSQDGLIRPHRAPKMASRGAHEIQMGCQNDVLRKIVNFKKTLFFIGIFIENDLGGARDVPNFDRFRSTWIDLDWFGVILVVLGRSWLIRSDFGCFRWISIDFGGFGQSQEGNRRFRMVSPTRKHPMAIYV